MSGTLSVESVSRNVGLARFCNNLAVPSVVTNLCPAMSRVWCVAWCSLAATTVAMAIERSPPCYGRKVGE